MIGGRGVAEQQRRVRHRSRRPMVRVAGALAAGELVVLVATAVVPAVGVVIAVGFWLVCAGWIAALATVALRSPRARWVTGWLWARARPASEVWLARAATGGRVLWVWLRMRTWAAAARGRGRSTRRTVESRAAREDGGLYGESL